MTPLQELIRGIWPLLPGLIPSLFVAWLIAGVVAAIRLGIDDFRGEHRSVLSELPFFLGAGLLLRALCSFSRKRAPPA
jgi:hypothetical protein